MLARASNVGLNLASESSEETGAIAERKPRPTDTRNLNLIQAIGV